MLDSKKVQRVAVAGVSQARHYFKIDPSWLVTVRLEGNLESAAQVSVDVKYKTAHIAISPQTPHTLEDVWRSAGHEVGHILLAEYDVFVAGLKQHIENFDKFIEPYRIAEERTNVALEQMWMRDCPYPADKYEPQPKPKPKAKKRGGK